MKKRFARPLSVSCGNDFAEPKSVSVFKQMHLLNHAVGEVKYADRNFLYDFKNSVMSCMFLLFGFLLFSTSLYSQDIRSKVAAAKSSGAVFQQVKLFDASTKSGAESFSGAVAKGVTFDIDEQLKTSFLNNKQESLTLEIPGAPGENPMMLELVRSNILSSDFKVTTSGNPKKPVKYEAGLHYQGVVAGEPKSLVAISVFNDRVMGLISTPKGNYTLGKIDGETKKHILYLESDLKTHLNFSCSTPQEDSRGYKASQLQSTSFVNTCAVRVYLEVGKSVYDGFAGNMTNTTNFVTGLFNQCFVLYANENIGMVLSEIFVWTTTDPYPGTSTGTVLSQFQSNTGAFNGDLGHLLKLQNIGGQAAGFDGLCNPDRDQSLCFSGLSGLTYQTVPTYSFNVSIITHEMGHLLGSRHTHACVWNGNNTAIDGCSGFVEGTCALPGSPAGGGTIMSYCHNDPVGINFNLGFGPQPGNVIRNYVTAATCLSTCCVLPTINAPALTQPTCALATGTIQVNATGSGALEYSVDNGATWSANATFNNLAPGNYRIRVRLQANTSCIATYSGNPVVLNQPPTGIIFTAPAVTQPSCPSVPTGTIVVNATGSGALEYSINNGSTYQPSNTFSGLAAGNYFIRARVQGLLCSESYSGNPVVINVANTALSTISYTGPAVAIPDGNSTGVNIPLVVSGLGTAISDLNFRLDAASSGTCDATIGNTNASVDHTWVGDLVFKLTSPGGTTVTLISQVNNANNGGNNFCTVLLDDDGGFSTIQNVTTAPVAGNFSPANPLSAFDGQNPNGTWTLNVSDLAGADDGSVRRFSLLITAAAPCASIPAASVTSVTVPPNSTYGIGTQLNFTVNWSEAVTITGSPFISITVGASTRQAAYVSGSGTTALLFRYVVSCNDFDNNGIAIGALSLNGGTITNTAAPATSANLTLNSVGSTASVNVSANAPVITAPTVTQPTCATATGTIVVNATGNGVLEYSINNGSSYQPSNTFGSLAPGSYDISVRFTGTTCVTSYSSNPVVLTAATGCCTPPVITAPTVTQPTCATPTGTIVVNATGSGALEYALNNGTYQSSATFSGLAAGNYNITVRLQASPTCIATYTNNPVVLTAATGCTAATNTTITSNSSPSCIGSSVSVTANLTRITAPAGPLSGQTLSFELTDPGALISTLTAVTDVTGNATVTFNAGLFSVPGNYSIQAKFAGTAALAASNSSVVTQVVASPPVINAPTVTQPTCATATGTIVVNATGSGTLEYALNNGTYQTSATFSGLAPGNYNITVRSQSAPSCVSTYGSNPVVLTAATGCCTPPVITTPTVTQPTCATPTGTIVVNATGSGALQYSLNNGPYQNSSTFLLLEPGSYNITVRLQSNTSCSTAYSGNPVVLNAATGCCVPPVITAPTVTQPTCATGVGSIVVNATGGGVLEYALNNGTYQTSNSFSNLTVGNYNITVRLQASPTCLAAYTGNPVAINAPSCPGKTIPGRVEAESFDAKNGPQYAVATGDPQGGVQHVVGIVNGSWMDYNVVVLQNGMYNVTFRVATTQNNPQFQVKLGATVLGTVSIPNTGGWNTWQNITVNNIPLTAGARTIRIQSVSNETCNFNWTDWVLAGANTAPTANAGPNQTVTNPPTTQVTLAGSGAANNGGTITSHVWSKFSGPAGGNITDPNNYGTTVTALQVGTYVFRLTVTDNAIQTATSDVTIIVNPASGKFIPGRVEAESFDAKSGPQYAVPTSDVGGGQHVIGMNNGSWLDYNVNVTQAGAYTVTFRVATTQNSSQFQIKQGATVLATVNIPNSSGWDNWINVPVTNVQLTGTGTQTLRIQLSSNESCNFNWMDWQLTGAATAPSVTAGVDNPVITLPTNSVTLNGSGTANNGGSIINHTWTKFSGPAGETITNPGNYSTTVTGLAAGTYVFRLTVTQNDNQAATADVTVTVNPVAGGNGKTIPGKVEAEAWDAKSGPQYAVPTSDAGGGQQVIGMTNGSWLDYNVTVLQTGSYTVNFRVATTQNNVQLQVKSGATVLGTKNIPNTGGWDTWQTVALNNIALTAGVQTIRVQLSSNESCNFNWTDWSFIAAPVTSQLITTSKQPSETDVTGNKLAASVFPNPTSSYFNLKVQTKSMEQVTVRILDIAGRQVQQLKGSPEQQSMRFGDNIMNGTYFVEVRQGAEKVVLKVMKQ